MNRFKVGYLIGSLSSSSINRLLARALVRLAPTELELTEISIRELPLYNRDQDNDYPAVARAFKDAVAAVDAVLFVTPEYNRSVPGVLKNAIDIASRPYGKSAWSGKPAAVMSVSPGAIGGFGANHHLRQSLVFLNMPALTQPEAYVGGAGDMFDEGGGFKKPDTKQFVEKFMTAFAAWIERNPKPA